MTYHHSLGSLTCQFKLGDKQIAKRRNENFYRVSAADLVAMLQSNQQPAAANQAPEEESKESIFGLMAMAQGGGGAQAAAASVGQVNDTTGAVASVGVRAKTVRAVESNMGTRDGQAGQEAIRASKEMGICVRRAGHQGLLGHHRTHVGCSQVQLLANQTKSLWKM